jgi:folylpolyglutamate synthase/dihydropteroate synthase
MRLAEKLDWKGQNIYTKRGLILVFTGLTKKDLSEMMQTLLKVINRNYLTSTQINIQYIISKSHNNY